MSCRMRTKPPIVYCDEPATALVPLQCRSCRRTEVEPLCMHHAQKVLASEWACHHCPGTRRAGEPIHV